MDRLMLQSHAVEDLRRELLERIPSEEDRAIVRRAVDLADKLHQGQRRASGEPFLVHPLHVGGILAGLRMDRATICAGILHDVLEDTPLTREELERRMDAEVASLVDGVTKIHILHARTKSVQEVETIRKMFLAMSNDIRVILIKLADKVHNMSTLEYLSPDRIQRIATECLELYAPLAARLGMNNLRSTLEDLALKHLDPEAYRTIESFVRLKESEREEFLQTVAKEIAAAAQAEGIVAEVQWRSKHFYSIYTKWKRKGGELSDIHDILGARIICNTVSECYALLGLIHARYKPIEGRFKDYIAMPKENGYQSLHTTVMCYGQLTEVQIRTRAMHQTAEHGIAAHWLYKEGGGASPAELEIFRRIREWSQNLGSGADFLESLKDEFLKDTIYVFTPKGKVIQLPKGSTPIDFAYAIHTEVGNHCYAAKADGAIIPLHHELKNTQVVEIITSPNARPNLNWLRYVKTSRARSKIRHWLTHNDPNILAERQVVAKKPETKPPPEKKPPPTTEAKTTVVSETSRIGVQVSDLEGMLVRYAKCCKPLPGDPIVGFVSRGRGLIVHKATCPNIKNIRDFEQRHVEVQWSKMAAKVVQRFRILAKKSPDLFSQIEGSVRKFGGHLLEGRLDEDEQGRWIGTFTMELEKEDDLAKVLKSLRAIPAVNIIQKID